MLLNDESTIHDSHSMGNAGNHSQVMRDPDDCHAQFFAQSDHKLNDLRLDGYIQGGSGSSAIRICGEQLSAIAIITR